MKIKKWLAGFLAITMLFSLCACGTAGSANEQASAQAVTITDMIGRQVTVIPGSYQRVVCGGAGALRMYCYIGDVNCKDDVRHGDYETICRIIDKLGEYGVEMIALLGGDPVHHPRIIDIIKYIKHHTLCLVSLMSNTLDFGNLPIRELAKYIDNIDFTLHGRCATEHEKYCNAPSGTYDAVMDKLKEYVSNGVVVNIAINIIPETFDKIYDMAKSVKDRGVDFSALLLQRIMLTK